MKSQERELRRRTDQGRYWWELRSCTYYDVMSRPKIVWPDIAKRSEFALDTSQALTDMTLFVTPTDDKVLLAILNSRVIEWLVGQTSSQIQQDFLRFKNIYVSPLPIPTASSIQRTAIERLVDRLLKASADNRDTVALEQELNALVYTLYGLTEDEIGLIEEQTRWNNDKQAVETCDVA